MTIVCATHFSDSSDDALAVASQLARRTGQPLWLVSVLHGVAFGARPTEHAVAAQASLELHAAALRADGVHTEVAVRRGRFGRVVAQLCAEVQARLVVVGGTRHVSPSFFATPADRLAEEVLAPLLVVRSRAPFMAWAGGERPLKVLLALDHTWRSEVARDWLARLSTFGELDVLAVHVWSQADERIRRHSTVADFEQLLRSETAAALVDLPSTVKTRVLLAHAEKDVASTLEQLANAEASDLVALGAHGPKGPLARLRSVTHALLVRGPASVALVPDRDVVLEPLDRMTPTSPAMRPRLHVLRRP